jgi:hypothetical protein
MSSRFTRACWCPQAGPQAPDMTRWASMAQAQEESEQTMVRLISSEGMPGISG